MSIALRLVQSPSMEVSTRRDYVNKNSSLEPKYGILFSDFVLSTVTKKSKRMGESYAAVYTTLIGHLKQFSEINEADIFTNSITEDFLDDFIEYLESLDLRQTYIKSLVSLVKTMTRKAGTYGYAVDTSWDDVDVDIEVPFSVYLSMNEITRIYYFRGLTKKQERIRDLFIVGCLTALRYSDYSTLTKDAFQGERIYKLTKKTKKKVILPVHEYIKEIYKKYDGEVSGHVGIQWFNRAIKSICRKVGLTESITYNYTKGGKMVTETKQKWELISSHTARRSAATNMYQTGRMKTYEIMALTGHTTEKSFFRYIKTSLEDTATQIAGDSFFRI